MTDTAADQPSRFQVSAIYQYDPRPTATGTRVRMCYGIANASGYYSEWSSRELAEAAVASERARIAAGGPAPAGLDPDSFQIRHMKPVTPSATDLAAIQAGLDRGQRMMSALSEGEGAADEDN
ncbi:MAG TPA: hypothetical protein VF474_16905 [Phenylobacterium sp.]